MNSKNSTIELTNEERKNTIIMNGQKCKLSNSSHVFDCHCNECYHNIKSYLGKEVGKMYKYTGKFAPVYLQDKKVEVLHFCADENDKTSSCECFLKLYGGEGGQVEWIPRREILYNLEEVSN